MGKQIEGKKHNFFPYFFRALLKVTEYKSNHQQCGVSPEARCLFGVPPVAVVKMETFSLGFQLNVVSSERKPTSESFCKDTYFELIVKSCAGLSQYPHQRGTLSNYFTKLVEKHVLYQNS